jgi:hypothetical protein
LVFVRFRIITLSIAAITLAACGGSSPSPAAPPPPVAPAATPVSWTQFRHLAGVVDVAGPRSDGSLLVAAAGRLLTMTPGGTLTPFARGADGYANNAAEPYLVLASSNPAPGGHCSFGKGNAFAIDSGARPTIIMISPQGTARRFATLPARLFLTGITYDSTGRFGHQLLVTARSSNGNTVFGVSCDGQVSTITANAPGVEGGIVVAPASFGAFGGDLIAPNENGGQVYAVEPSGKVVILVRSGLPAGGDIGVESAGFVPAQLSAAYLADRVSPGNRHPGDNEILRLSAAQLAQAGVRPGDLLVATEGGARTIDVRCAAACTVHYVGAGPAIAHAEGHIAFASP